MDRFIDRLPPVFAAAGLLGLVVAAGLYLYGGGLDRYAVPAALASLALLLYYVVERPREIARAITGRTARYGGNALAMSLAFLGILALLNVLTARFTYRLDLTEGKQFTLSPQTVKVLSELQTPVKVTAFYREGQGREEVEDILKQFGQHTKQIEVEYIDPELKPGLARQYGVDFAGTTVLEAGEKRQTVMGTGEGELVSGILKVTRGEPRKVYVLIGHGEPDPESFEQSGFSSAKQALEAENYKVEALNLVAAGKVPEDAALLVLAGPTRPLLPAEGQALTDYLDAGGKALLLADPGRLAGLPELAARYGAEIVPGMVVETGQSLPNEPLVPIIAGRGYQYSPITRNMPTMTIFPTATLVRPGKSDASAKYQVSTLAQTTERSWLKTDLTSRQLSLDPTKDVQGPLAIAVSVQAVDRTGATAAADAGAQRATRLVIIGDVDFATNGVLNWEGNRDFLVNSVNWLAEDEDLISVRAKASVDRRMTLTGGQVNLVAFLSIFVVPFGVLGVGAWMVWGRR